MDKQYLETLKSIRKLHGCWEWDSFFKGYRYWVKYDGVQYRTACYEHHNDKFADRLKVAIADKVSGKDHNLVCIGEALFQLPSCI